MAAVGGRWSGLVDQDQSQEGDGPLTNFARFCLAPLPPGLFALEGTSGRNALERTSGRNADASDSEVLLLLAGQKRTPVNPSNFGSVVHRGS